MADCYSCIIAMKNFEPRTPAVVTNADRIRAMSDEDLARTFTAGCDGRACIEWHQPLLYPKEDSAEQCAACWLGWLKSSAEEAEGDGDA